MGREKTKDYFDLTDVYRDLEARVRIPARSMIWAIQAIRLPIFMKLR